MTQQLTPDRLIYPIVGQSIPIVYDAYDKWSAIAQSAFAKAQQLATQIADIPLSPVAFNAHFDPQIALTPFPTLAKPTPVGDLSLTLPPLPPEPPTITVPVLPPLDYVSSLLDQMKGVITTLLGGNPLPASVASALRNRAYSDAYAEESRAVAQAYDEFGARGFDEPRGTLNKRITQARNDARNKRQQINRDVFIQEQLVAVENLRFAVTSGVQLEGMQVTVFRAKADVALETVRISAETNRLLMDGWRAKVELYDTQLKGEMAQLDAALRAFLANVSAYQADAQIATAAGEFDNRRFQLNLAQEQAIVDTEMKRADQGFEQMRFITSVMLEIKKTLAAVSSQLAASAMSAVNVGASLSSSSSESLSYSLGLSYSGSMDNGA
jgi:hypothetical protein